GFRLSSPPGNGPSAAATVPPAIGSSPRYTASAVGRAAGSLASIAATSASIAADTEGLTAATEGATDSWCATRSGTRDDPWNGTSPVSSSNSRQPSEYTSDAGVTSCPAHCSGDI